MCHCFQSVDEMSAKEREEVLAEHTEAELREEYSAEELAELGIAA